MYKGLSVPSSVSIELVLRDELNIEKENLEREFGRRVTLNELMRALLTLWRQQRHDPRPVPQRGENNIPTKLSPEDIKRLKDLIAQNE